MIIWAAIIVAATLAAMTSGKIPRSWRWRPGSHWPA
jgi:hypothetical protein